MGARGLTFDLIDFSGGLNTYDPEYLLALNQSPDLQNINLLQKGFAKRRGDTAFNSSAMGSSSTAITGLGYILFNDATDSLNAVAGTKFYTSAGLSGTMTDKTGAITITSGQNNKWTPLNFNNIQIWFGGAPDAPFKHSGSGNAAALGGTPPSAYTGFASNNRIFGVSTAANPSRVFWPIISNPEDWTGAGSGSADVALSDGEALQCGVPLNADVAILFKNSSTHMMVTTTQPFPVYQLQKGVGIAGRYAYAVANGEIYFITPSRRMKSTSDGLNFTTYPHDIDTTWDTVNTTQIPNIQGIYYQNLEQIHWYVASGSATSNNRCIIWDLINKCWLYHPTGYKVNVACLASNRRLFAGHYDGKIYEKDIASTWTDASETSPGAIDAYWRTPSKGVSTVQAQTQKYTAPLANVIHPLWVDFACAGETATVLTVSYGFDFSSSQASEDFSLLPSGAQWDVGVWDVGVWGGQSSVVNRIFTKGRGNLFSMKFRNAIASQGYTFQGASVQLRTDKARRLFTAA